MLLSRTAAVLRGLFSSGQLRRLARTGRRGLFASGQLTFSGEPTLVNLDRSPDSFLPTNYTSLDILILAVLYSTIRCCVNLKDGSDRKDHSPERRRRHRLRLPRRRQALDGAILQNRKDRIQGLPRHGQQIPGLWRVGDGPEHRGHGHLGVL